jgi:stringent starvation protein B
MMERQVEEKKERLLAALDAGVSQIHIDARLPGVLVPDQFRAEHHLVLNLSYRFDPPDLTVNDWGVRETLSFGGRRFMVGVPWSAIYAVAALGTRDVWMFPDDMPKEVSQAAVDRVETDSMPKEGHPRPRAILREVSMAEVQPSIKAESSVEAPVDQEPPKPPTEPKRSHLRLVK